MESKLHKENAFVTLTYGDEYLPADGSVSTEEHKQFMYRLREAYKPLKVRFFGIGEYGDDSCRPHYHYMLFGFPTCVYGRSLYSRHRDTCCPNCEFIRKVWGKGHVLLGQVTDQSARYVSDYLCKAMTKPDDPRLKGRAPEFSRMSLRPGLGHGAMDEVASALLQHNLEKLPDVPTALRHGNKLQPLGRYLRRRLRVLVGQPAKAPDVEHSPEMSALWNHAVSSTPRGEIRTAVFKDLVLRHYAGARHSMASKRAIFKAKRKV